MKNECSNSCGVRLGIRVLHLEESRTLCARIEGRVVGGGEGGCGGGGCGCGGGM